MKPQLHIPALWQYCLTCKAEETLGGDSQGPGAHRLGALQESTDRAFIPKHMPKETCCRYFLPLHGAWEAFDRALSKPAAERALASLPWGQVEPPNLLLQTANLSLSSCNFS